MNNIYLQNLLLFFLSRWCTIEGMWRFAWVDLICSIHIFYSSSCLQRSTLSTTHSKLVFPLVCNREQQVKIGSCWLCLSVPVCPTICLNNKPTSTSPLGRWKVWRLCILPVCVVSAFAGGATRSIFSPSTYSHQTWGFSGSISSVHEIAMPNEFHHCCHGIVMATT